MEAVREFAKRLGYLWYIVDPRDHMYDKVEDVPDYYFQVTPIFIFVIVLEQTVRLLQGKGIFRLNDTVTNICHGILLETFKIPLHGIELICYTWIFNNWRLVSLPWNSIWTWLLCLVSSDFCFYWMHRGLHQISFLWMFHETHHSSEDYNFTTPLRLSIFHSATLWMTYLPLAFAIPPPIYLVHYQLNIIFQFWLHTEVITNLGVIEWIFVTPSHHRVHHGRNRRCIDKNFGSVFILWDRMFGTFEVEGKQPIAYGVTKPLRTFSPITVQFNHPFTVLRRLVSLKGFVNKLSCIAKGPGWSPGKPWLGRMEDIPEPKEDEQKYDPKLPTGLKFYVLLHTAALIIGHLLLALNLPKIDSYTFAVCGSYLALTTLSLGYLLDLNTKGAFLELIRCPLYFAVETCILKQFGARIFLLNVLLYGFRSLSFSSFVFWIFEVFAPLSKLFIFRSNKYL